MLNSIKNKQFLDRYNLLVLFIALAPDLVSAKTFGQLTGSILSILSDILVFIIGLIVIIFAWRMLSIYFLDSDRGGDKAMEKGKNTIIYTVLALAVLLSIWGLAKVLSGTLFP